MRMPWARDGAPAPDIVVEVRPDGREYVAVPIDDDRAMAAQMQRMAALQQASPFGRGFGALIGGAQSQQQQPIEPLSASTLRIAALELQVGKYKNQIERMQLHSNIREQRLRSLADEVDRVTGLLRTAVEAVNRATSLIPQDYVARLIRLCHPDKHDNSEAANEITRWLLDQRK